MTREELLEECFGRSDFSPPLKAIEMLDEATGDVQAHVEVYLRRLIVRRPPSPALLSEASTTLTVAALDRLCVAPDHRGKRFAEAMIRRAHAELEENRPLSFVVVRLREPNPGAEMLLGRLGYSRPRGTPDGFWVHKLRDDEDWPAGSIRFAGDWE